MHYGVKTKNVKLITYLVEHGSKFIQNCDGKYPIDLAVEGGDWDMINFLSKLGSIVKDSTVYKKEKKARKKIKPESEEEDDGDVFESLTYVRDIISNNSLIIGNKLGAILESAREYGSVVKNNLITASSVTKNYVQYGLSRSVEVCSNKYPILKEFISKKLAVSVEYSTHKYYELKEYLVDLFERLRFYMNFAPDIENQIEFIRSERELHVQNILTMSISGVRLILPGEDIRPVKTQKLNKRKCINSNFLNKFKVFSRTSDKLIKKKVKNLQLKLRSPFLKCKIYHTNKNSKYYTIGRFPSPQINPDLTKPASQIINKLDNLNILQDQALHYIPQNNLNKPNTRYDNTDYFNSIIKTISNINTMLEDEKEEDNWNHLSDLTEHHEDEELEETENSLVDILKEYNNKLIKAKKKDTSFIINSFSYRDVNYSEIDEYEYYYTD